MDLEQFMRTYGRHNTILTEVGTGYFCLKPGDVIMKNDEIRSQDGPTAKVKWVKVRSKWYSHLITKYTSNMVVIRRRRRTN